MIDKESLGIIRQNVVEEAAKGLAQHNKALGAIELLDYLLAQLENDNDTGNGVDSGPEAGDDPQAGIGNISDSGNERIENPDGAAIGDTV